jgi:hypothetical protein
MGDLQDSSPTARKIGQNPRVVVGTPSYFAAAGEPTKPAELVSHQAVTDQTIWEVFEVERPKLVPYAVCLSHRRSPR